MTDRPFAGGADTAAGPTPGYYPDPSIPGFVRYWGGAGWVPGTSRRAPAEGEHLPPPHFASRQAPPVVPPRHMPPPVVIPAPPAPRLPEPSADGETGPVFLDQTGAGAAFTMAPQAELELRARAAVEPHRPAVVASAAAPGAPAVVAEAVGVVEADPVPVVRRAELLPLPPLPATPADVYGPMAPESAESGWRADPAAQRGLLETGAAPRWVSWGVLGQAGSGVADAVEGTVDDALEVEAAAAVGSAPEVAPERPVAAEPSPVEVRAEPAAVESVVVKPVAVEPAVEAPAVEEPAVVRSAPAKPARTKAATARPAGAGPAPAKPRSAKPAPAKSAARKPAALRPAGLGRRLFARAVDTVVVAVVAAAGAVPLSASAVAHLREKLEQAQAESHQTGRAVQVWMVDPVVAGKAAALLGLLVLLGVLYEVLPTARTGQTFGKRLAGIRVVDVKVPTGRSNPRPPRPARALLRWLVGQLTALLVVGLLWPLLDRRSRRGLHDRAAGTRVVRA
ncbi:RDD family protein [Kitasatospora sp. NPDC094015]|uniref:RDD family protein n=1 Tax=Kitasatospora sp. NPDC094015 TaxID=3155205 RepID=UPI00332D9165